MLAHLLAAPVFQRNVAALETLSFDMRDVYPPTHWAITGTPPAYDTPDEDVYLAGRNLVLLTKAGVVAARRHASRIALGPLAGNPFPDATPEFFAAMASALSLGLASEIDVATPFVRSAQGGCHSAGRVARCSAGAHAVLHESGRGPGRTGAEALRPLQQVPRAARWVCGRGCCRPDDLRTREPAVTKDGTRQKTEDTRQKTRDERERRKNSRQIGMESDSGS